jgi:hypothetical protein
MGEQSRITEPDADWWWARGDTRPAIEWILDTGDPFDTLADVDELWQHMKHTTVVGLIVSTQMTIQDSVLRRVRYTPLASNPTIAGAGDLDVVGVYLAEFEAIYLDGGRQTFGPKAYRLYEVTPDIADATVTP